MNTKAGTEQRENSDHSSAWWQVKKGARNAIKFHGKQQWHLSAVTFSGH
jgi:hypothetical protein